MATVNVNLTCDLQHPVQVQYIGGNMFSQDNAGNTVNVDVFNDGEPATLGGSISANVIRADGATVAVSGALSGNRAYVIFPQACYAVPGTITVIIKNTESSTVTTIAAFVANVYQSTTDTVVDPGAIIPSVSALIAQIEAAVDSIPVDYSGLLATIAADYSSSKTYPVVGMYAWQGGVLKRNIVPITTAETYTAAHWTNAVIGDDLSALKSAIDELKPLGMNGDKYVYTASSGYQNVPITLAAGKYRAINTSSTSATFRDSNNTTISGLSVSHTSAGQYATLTITSEQASEIAYIRLYQGYVEIFPEDSILDDIKDINVELTKKADKPIKYTKVQITIESGYRNKNGTTYSSGQHFEVTVGGGVVSYKISGQHANSDYPFICAYDQSNNETFAYSGTAGAVSDYIFAPPAGTTHFYVNANNNGKCASGEEVDILTYFEDTETSLYQLRQDRESRYNLDKKNPFAWKTFDKAYFSWMNDDGRSDMYLYKDLCDDYNIPYANSMPWEVIDANTTVVDGMTVVNYCKQIITDGGEIFTHANNPLTSSSTEADIMQYFRDGKRIIEDAVGCKVSGIIQAGGSGYSTFDYNEGQMFCLAYYEYSDAYGTTPQYTLARTRIARSSYDSDDAQIAAFKDVVDDAIANHKWVRFYCHGTSEVSIDVLTSVFNYIATKVANGDCAWTTWKNMYDTFRSSSLENRIAAMED